MSKDVSFSLDTRGFQAVLTNMIKPTIEASAQAIAQRGQAMASSISSEPPVVTATTTVRPAKKGGGRVVGVIRATGSDAHQNYIGHVALAKAKDAGRV